MAQLSKETRLGPVWGLIVALAFPVSYGIYDFIARKKTNLFSVLGFVGILLSGVLGLSQKQIGELEADGVVSSVPQAATPRTTKEK